MIYSSVSRLRFFGEFFARFVLGRTDLHRGSRVDTACQFEHEVAAAQACLARAALFLWLSHGKVLLSALSIKLIGDYSIFTVAPQVLLLFYSVYAIIYINQSTVSDRTP